MSSHSATFVARRKAFVDSLGDKTVVVCSGRPRLRNMTAATYPYRASSEFLHLFGFSVPGAVGLLSKQEQKVLLDDVPKGDEIWHGKSKGIEDYKSSSGLEDISFKNQSQDWLGNISASNLIALPTLDPISNREIEAIIGRALEIYGRDNLAVSAMLNLRLLTDEYSLEQIRLAVSTTKRAFELGFDMLEPGLSERDIKAVMEAECIRQGVELAFPSIVTRRGNILHCLESFDTLAADDLLLVDFGAESSASYASDVTRTWSVGKSYEGIQRDLYQLVFNVQQTAIKLIAPEVEFAEIHKVACQVLAGGLVDLGLLKGDAEELVEKGAHALFFPHGLGHLLGLDAHDMELFGDLAGYAPGRCRSEQFGSSSLRLDRALEPGMVVTIEPGIYNIESLIQPNEELRDAQRYLADNVSAMMDEFTGVRIEDMVLVTEDGHEVLSAAIPSELSSLET